MKRYRITWIDASGESHITQWFPTRKLAERAREVIDSRMNVTATIETEYTIRVNIRTGNKVGG